VLGLVLYGLAVLVLTLAGLSVHVRVVRGLWRMGDLGIELARPSSEPGRLVTFVHPSSPAARVVRTGDRLLWVGDVSLLRLRRPRSLDTLGTVWRYLWRPIAPGQAVPVVLIRAGERRPVRTWVRAGPAVGLDRRYGPDSLPLGVFTFGWLLPSRLTLWSFLLVGWVVLLRRPTSRQAQLLFLVVTTAALSFSYTIAPAPLYPMPLQWLARHAPAVEAWIVALGLNFLLVMGEEHPLYRRFHRGVRFALYLPVIAITALALAETLSPATRPAWMALEQRFRWLFWIPGWILYALLFLHKVYRAESASARRQARTVLLATAPWIVLQVIAAATPQPFPPWLYLALAITVLFVPVGLAYSILYQGLLDLGLVLRRGLVYGIVLVAGVAGYYLLVLTTSKALLGFTGQTSPLATMASTLALAMLLRPIALYSRRWVDRAFYRDRLETLRRLGIMSREMLSLLDRDRIIEYLTSQLPATFPAAGAHLFLRHPTEERYVAVNAPEGDPAPSLLPKESALIHRLEQTAQPVATYSLDANPAALAPADRALVEKLGAVLWLPLLLRERLAGVLALGWKASEEIYTEEEIEALTLITSEAAVALENAALTAAREEQARLQQEVAIGRSIQMSLLPPERLQAGRFQVYSRSEPAMEVGGDFYNLFETGNGARRLGIVLGDVAGKGVPAALFMAVTTTLIRGQARLLPTPAATLTAANAELYPLMRPNGRGPALFATAVYGVLDTETGEVRLASAGQTPPIYWPAGGAPGYVRLIGLPLGALPRASYEEMTLSLNPRDRLLLCSDGFIEQRGEGGEHVGYDGFLRRLEALAGCDGPALIESLFRRDEETATTAQEAGIADDRTLVLIEARG
jgi:serine phosphatase RsbU (regulator of sigma subunit)